MTIQASCGDQTNDNKAPCTAVAQRVSAQLPVNTVVESTALLQGEKAVNISHNGAVYRLQSTKLGKLILTK